MAQAMPRYCPRCGTPTRADMVRCATCELPVEAMLGRSGNRPFRATDEATPQGAAVPTPRQTAQEGHYPPSMPLRHSQDLQSGWGAPAELPGPPHFSPVSPIPLGPEEWNTLGHSGSPSQAYQAEARSAATQLPDIDEMDTLTTPEYPQQDSASQAPEMGTWAAPSYQANGPTSQAPEMGAWGPANYQANSPTSQAPEMGAWAAPAYPQNNPASQAPEMNAWGAPSYPPNNPASQTPENAWGAPAYPPNNPASQAPWTAQPEPSQTPRPRGKRRAGVVFIVLVILLVLAGGGYFAFSALGGHVPGVSQSQATIKTTNLNETVPYAGVDVTLLNAQQAQNFIDDPHTASDGMLRLKLQEQNKTSVAATWDYTQSARLIIQGKAPVAPTYVKAKGSIAPGATQTSEIDFAVANGGNLSQMIFQLGTDKEAQMQIPLNGQANLSQYQPQTAKQNGTTTYFGLDWTLTGSTTSLSIAGQQATSGMEFLTLNLSVDNTLSQEAISGSPFEYMRVKAGGKTVAPVSTTIPVSFASGATGKTGTATFLIPQNSASCSLIMLSQDSGGSGQASINFKLG